MRSGAGAFLSRLVDYAGLFPPASLGLTEAVAEYERHRGENERWMLGRFIVPAARCGELAAVASPHVKAGDTWPLTVLVGGAGGPQAILAALPAQCDAVRLGVLGSAGRFRVEALEARLPPDAGFATIFSERLAQAGLEGTELYFEVPADGDEQGLMDDIAAASGAQTGADRPFTRLGVKLRCGGETPGAVPSPARIAAVIDGCARRSLPVKFTAGLHHPVRHRTAQTDMMMHGFFNVVGAALLAMDGLRDLARLEACVAETEAAAFRLDDHGFAWRECAVAAADVAHWRAERVAGFGSCSFDEPRRDLRALGLL